MDKTHPLISYPKPWYLWSCSTFALGIFALPYVICAKCHITDSPIQGLKRVYYPR